MFLTKKSLYRILWTVLCGIIASAGHAQPNSVISLDYKDKPVKYQTKILPVEKSGEGELHGWKKLIQGTYAHYNFLFNANMKLEEAMETARRQKTEDYTQLLSFDNYDTAALARNAYLDTAIQKANGSLLLHDVRNEWNDEVYLILGKAFYFKHQLDSAAVHFQYLNYAFAPKDEGYDLPLVSNETTREGQVLIASPRQKGFLKHAPRRNLGLIWLARTLIMQGQITTAEEMLQLLRDDPGFPDKLLPELDACTARAYYYTRKYDSAAVYLMRSMKGATDAEDRARRHFLAAQLFALSRGNDEAIHAFDYAASHTSDVLMEIYARLQIADLDTSENKGVGQLDKLLALSKKLKYKDYKVLIYYMLGNKYLQRNDSSNAIAYFSRATKSPVVGNNNRDLEYKYRSFQKLGDLSESQFRFTELVSNYDSIKGLYGPEAERMLLQSRKEATAALGKYLNTLHTEDSLQFLSRLPEDQQNKILKSHLKHIRKQLGLREDDNQANTALFNNGQNATPTDLFSGVANKSGDWYFNNNDVKAQGYLSFVSRFGDRPNVDNWIRQSALRGISASPSMNNAADTDSRLNKVDSSKIDLAFLKDQLLDTPEKMALSQRKKMESYFGAGVVMETQLEDYTAAIWFYRQAMALDSSADMREKLLYHLATAQYALGDKAAANDQKQALEKAYPNSTYFRSGTVSERTNVSSATSGPGKLYAGIYDDFLAGNFGKAKTEKQKADSMYGNSYWTPQLLYIESVYYVAERQDSNAIVRLQALEQLFPQSPIREKAATMIDVLSRRKEIENYLTNLQITKLEDTDEVYQYRQVAPRVDWTKKAIVRNTDTVKQVVAASQPVLVVPKVAPMVRDSSAGPAKYVIDVDKPHYAMLVLEKVAKVFATEAGNAFNRFNKQNFYNEELPVASEQLDDTHFLVLIGPFKVAGDAYLYIDKVAPVTPQRILPWLTKDKYSFSMISEENLELLRKYKTLTDYQRKLHETLPGKF